MEIKELSDDIKSTWEKMKATNDAALAEAKKTGTITAESKAVLEKMGTRLDELELKLQRQALVPVHVTDRPILSEEAQAHKKTFYKWFRGGMEGLDPAERKLMAAHKIESKSLVENSTGLYLVPEDLEAEIYRAIGKICNLRNICSVRPTTRDKVRRRSLTEVSMGWGKLETGTAITESSQVPSQDYIYVEDLYGLTKIGEDELDDTDANLEALIVDSFARAKAEAEDTAFTVGTGHTYSQPEGVTLDTTIISTYTDLDTADTITPTDLLDIEYELPPQYLNGAAYLMARKTEKAVRLVRAEVAAGYYGNYLWQPSLLVGQPNNFDGFPIYNQGDMVVPASTNTDRSIVAIFGNFKAGYQIVDRKGLAIQRLNELYAEAGLVGFKAHFRVGGAPVRPDAFRALDNHT